MKGKREQELETINELADRDYDVGDYLAVLQVLEEHFLGDDFEKYVSSKLESADGKVISLEPEQLEEVSDLMLSQYTTELISYFERKEDPTLEEAAESVINQERGKRRFHDYKEDLSYRERITRPVKEFIDSFNPVFY